LNFQSATYAALDSLNHADLYRSVAADIEEKRRFSTDLAERLDRLFTVKLVRLLRSPSVSDEAFEQLDNLIARIARDSYRDELESMPARYASRWQALRDVMVANRQIDAFDGAVRESNKEPTSAWEIVARMVVAAGSDGVQWSDAKTAVIASALGPKTKGGVSQMISAMRVHGWIDALPSTGQRVILVAGKNIACSSAWKGRHADVVVTDSPVEAPPAPAKWQSNKLNEVTRQAVTLNQGAFLDFSHLAHERHRQLRKTIDDSTLAHSRQSRQTRLRANFKSLISFMDQRFGTVAGQNFKLLGEYFAGRSDVGPRMSIMGNWQGADKSVCVGPLVRNDQVDYDSVIDAAKNTGFDSVIKSGAYYLNNNIVKTALNGRYRNPRFDYDAIGLIQQQIEAAASGIASTVTPRVWRNLWKGSTEHDDPRIFYQSTLIVPLTLRNENLSAEFNHSLSTRLDRHTGDRSAIAKHEQSILGFLCFDHPDIDYFHPEHDVNTAYVFATLLSMYVLERITLTTLSETYQASKQLLEANATPVESRPQASDQGSLIAAPSVLVHSFSVH
jgi:hypothetical protein